MFAEDAHEMVIRIFEQAKARGEEIAIDEGFDLYKQLATVRRLFHNTHEEYDPRYYSVIPLELANFS